MKWIDEPFSLDPQEMARNFAASSTLDRSKIFAIFVVIAIAVFILPVLICLQVDGHLGGNSEWFSVLAPLWIWNLIVLTYHGRVLAMGPIHRPDSVSPDDWVDPLPMSKRIFSLFRFSLILISELLVCASLDNMINLKWAEVFIPIYIWEITTLIKKVPQARTRIVTVEDLETALGKPYRDFTQAEKDLISKRYSVVPSLDSPEFEQAHKLKSRAKQDVVKVIFRVIFLVFLITQLDSERNWNWWYIFTPFWVMSFCICCGSYQAFAEAQTTLAEKDPSFFNSDVENDNKAANNISREEQEELKSQLLQSGYRMMTSCCTQAFVLLIVGLFVGKIQGASYSSLWIISPLLLSVSVILFCLGCTIFCITDVNDIEHMGDTGAEGAGVGSGYENMDSNRQNNGGASLKKNTSSNNYKPPDDPTVPKSTWDPEKGQVWDDPTELSSPIQSITSSTNTKFNSSSTAAAAAGESTRIIQSSRNTNPGVVHSTASDTGTNVTMSTTVDLLDDLGHQNYNAIQQQGGETPPAPVTSAIDELD